MYPIQTSLLITLKNRLGAYLFIPILPPSPAPTYSSAGLVVCRIASV